jgi:hypothetical protein
MRHPISAGLAAAALGTALAVACAFPASAQVARPLSAFAGGVDNNSDLTMVAGRRGGGGGGRGGHAFRGGGGGGNFAMRSGGGRNFAMHSGGNRSVNVSRNNSFRAAGIDRGDLRRWNNNDGRWRDRNNWGGWGVASGVALGYGLGYGLGSSYPYSGYSDYGYGGYGYGDYASSGDSDSGVAYCISRFRTYDQASGTYMGNDGRRHSCP